MKLWNAHHHDPTIEHGVYCFKDPPLGNVDIPHALGTHPWWEKHVDFENLLCHPKLVAIGESGLDRTRGVDFTVQTSRLEWHADLAKKHQLPLVLHCVRAGSDLLALMKRHDLPGVMIHDAWMSEDMAKDLLSKGAWLSLSPRHLEKPRWQALATLANRSGKLLLESDTQDVAWLSFGHRASELLQSDLPTLADTLEERIHTLFPRLTR